MTRAARHPAPAAVPRRTGGDVARGLAALVALVGLLAGLPALLYAVAGNPLPTSLPSWPAVTAALTGPDDGRLLMRVLALLGWAGWAWFTLSVAVEIPAQLRGRHAPHLPALGPPQRAASTLVAAAAVLLLTPTAPLALPARPAVAAAALHQRLPAPPTLDARPDRATAPQPAPPPVGRAHTDQDGARAQPVRQPPAADQHPPGHPQARSPAEHGGPVYTVRRHDTLWGIAERHLGDGERFPQIAALNYGVPQPDGHALTDTHWISPGWRLRLPPDATRLPATGEAEAVRGTRSPGDPAPNVTYTVRSGDTLWDLAEDRLGAGQRYPRIAAASRRIRQPDGDHLDDPDHIEPGWTLRLPTGAAPNRPPRHAPSSPTQPAAAALSTRPRPDRPAHASAPPTATPAPLAELMPPAATSPPEPAPSAATATGHAVAAGPGVPTEVRTDRNRQQEEGVPDVAVWALGLTGIAAGGLLAALARRRVEQQRRRRPGRRIRMPGPELRPAEAALRAADNQVALHRLDAVLRALADSCSTAGRLLPDLAAVRLGDDGAVELLLAGDDADPAYPFTPAGPRTWRLDTSAADARQPDRAGSNGGAFPYPALVSIGRDEDTTVLLNLEAPGTLTITGPPEHTRPLLTALATELATSPLTASAALTLVGPEIGPVPAEHGRLRLVDNLDGILSALHAHTTRVRELLAQADADSVRAARSRHVARDTWAPEIVLLAGPLTAEQTSRLHNALPTRPPPGVVLVLATPETSAGEAGWTLSPCAAGRLRVDPLDLTVVPQRLAHRDSSALHALLSAATDTGDIEATPHPPPVDALTGREPRAGAITDADAAATPVDEAPVEPATVDAPIVEVLGPVQVSGAAGDEVDSTRRRKMVELAAFLALHPGADNHGIDEAIWPARRVSPATRNSATSRLRRWLGRTPAGESYLPLVPDGGGYRLHPDVRCDWHLFDQCARRGFAAGPDGLEQLTAALDLVRGRPFTGVDPASYTWAEADTQEMISAVTDVAHALAAAHLAAGNPAAARSAAAKGLLAEPCSELLYRDAIRAAAARGDTEDIHNLADRLRTQLTLLDPDAGMEPETAELLTATQRQICS